MINDHHFVYMRFLERESSSCFVPFKQPRNRERAAAAAVERAARREVVARREDLNHRDIARDLHHRIHLNWYGVIDCD